MGRKKKATRGATMAQGGSKKLTEHVWMSIRGLHTRIDVTLTSPVKRVPASRGGLQMEVNSDSAHSNNTPKPSGREKRQRLGESSTLRSKSRRRLQVPESITEGTLLS
jgi:hypothetical protein